MRERRVNACLRSYQKEGCGGKLGGRTCAWMKASVYCKNKNHEQLGNHGV